MVLLLFNPNSASDEHVAGVLEAALHKSGHDIFADRRDSTDIEHAKEMGDWIRKADQVVALISPNSAASETFEYQLESVATSWRVRGKPDLVTVRVGSNEPLSGPVSSYAIDDQSIIWDRASDDSRVVGEVIAALGGDAPGKAKAPSLEPAGTVPPGSQFYTLRNSDSEMDGALWSGETVILIHGPRQIGKTSLIGRGTELVQELNWRTVSTDFQKLNSFQLTDIDKFCLLLAKTIARQLDFSYDFDKNWADDFGPNLNLDHFVRTVLNDSKERLVWFMDEADRIFTAPFASDFYGLVRSWHNARATDPKGPWDRLTVVIGYATEARLFIQDMNQSPFNVGKHISLEGFNLHQTSDLNDKYGAPLKRRSDLEGVQFLLGGQPMLTRRALELLATGAIDYLTLVETADRDDGPFADHLKRVLFSVSQAPDVLETLRTSLSWVPMSDSDTVQRLVSAGILRETPEGKAILACDLYGQYLARHLS